MPISAQEQADIDANKRKCENIRERVMDLSRMADRVETSAWTDYAKMIGRTGLNKDQVIAAYVREGLKDIENVWKSHVKKYPD